MPKHSPTYLYSLHVLPFRDLDPGLLRPLTESRLALHWACGAAVPFLEDEDTAYLGKVMNNNGKFAKGTSSLIASESEKTGKSNETRH
ncbi:hypothetical protein DV515_00001884 [Chloebia gouldiae]|uniref:Uncharacterized protein n=1 Tax=Chloebia gouldiae TaxID=44316 RepID=A0A3L8SXY1_CHLGU|nr:hypothetical protein DV515_00001884 [Chloebia gouldiae]